MGGMKIKILVACEESQTVTKELRRLGHEAYSCDVIECSGGKPEWHTKQDVLPLLNGNCEFSTCDGAVHKIDGEWDMIIAFPPCTDLAVSGARNFAQKRADGRQQRSIEFFMQFANCGCQRVAIENPVGIMSSTWRRPDQIIQPWQFGDNVGKSTCLWLKGLPPLVPEVQERPTPEYHTWVKANGKIGRQEMWYYNTRCLPHSERGTAAVEMLIKFIKQSDDACDYCKNLIECKGEGCECFEQGKGGTIDGKEYPDFKWTCEDFDHGTCRMMENTPCNGCFENDCSGFEWRGPQAGKGGPNE